MYSLNSPKNHKHLKITVHLRFLPVTEATEVHNKFRANATSAAIDAPTRNKILLWIAARQSRDQKEMRDACLCKTLGNIFTPANIGNQCGPLQFLNFPPCKFQEDDFLGRR